LIGGYWALLALAAVPGYGAGVLLQHHNIIQYLNAAYLARYRLSGVLSVAPAGALALLGTVAGSLLWSRRLGPHVKAAIFLAAGASLAAGGLMWSHALPLSKDLWTPSYAVLSGGIGWLLLGLCYLAFDVARWRAAGVPLAVFGTNAISAYVASAFVVQALQYWRVPAPGGAAISLQAALLFALQQRLGIIGTMWAYTGGIILGWWLVLLILYWKRVLIRV
jgi:predicted acyltransferase